MTRIARPPRRQVVAVVSGWLLFAAFPFLPPATGPRLLLAGFAVLVLLLTLDLLAVKASASPEGIVLGALRPRKRLRARVDEIVRYACDREGVWWVETMERRVPVSVKEPWEFHAAMALLVPAKLGAKRMRPQHLPPDEDFRGLWVYDVERLLSETLGRAVAVVTLVALTRTISGAYGILLGPLLFGVFDMFARLDVTREGIVRRGPFHRRTIPWADAVAIFCERSSLRRSFVVTSRETAIEVPEHLAKDLELMRKVFRSLPEGTLCVNFDETTFRGYRRRKKAKEAVPQEDLMPALTA